MKRSQNKIRFSTKIQASHAKQKVNERKGFSSTKLISATLLFFTVGLAAKPVLQYPLKQSETTKQGSFFQSNAKTSIEKSIEKTSSNSEETRRIDPLQEEAMLIFERERKVGQLRRSFFSSPAKYSGLVEFITGMIAVYYPKASDPGLIAKDIVEISLEQKVNPFYVASVIAVESSFKKHAKSHVGATGLMQIMPATAKSVAKSKVVPELTDPKVNIRLGIKYLKSLEKSYKGNKFYALAAYNWGPGNMGKSLRGQKRLPGSVKGYANKIISRTEKWQEIFQSASKNAAQVKLL